MKWLFNFIKSLFSKKEELPICTAELGTIICCTLRMHEFAELKGFNPYVDKPMWVMAMNQDVTGSDFHNLTGISEATNTLDLKRSSIVKQYIKINRGSK